MPSFGFFERKEILLPNPTIPAPPLPIIPSSASSNNMRLTPPLRLDPANASSDAYGIAVLAQASFPSSELALLRFGAVAEKESLAYLTRTAERGIREKLNGPRIRDVDGTADLPGDGKEVVREHLVIRDLDLAPFKGGEDDVAVATGMKAEGSMAGMGGELGRIVSHAEWEYRPRDWVEQRVQEEQRKKMDAAPLPPEGTNVALVNDFEGKVIAMWVNLMGGREHYVLYQISTLPSHAGRGLARALVSWIFPRADREGRICFLCASPMGYGLYKKLGFEEVGGVGSVVEIDRSEWGGAGVHRHIAMVRFPVGWTGCRQIGEL